MITIYNGKQEKYPTQTYISEVQTSCGSIDNSGNFQLDDAIYSHDAKISGDYLYILGRTCNPNFQVVNGEQHHYVYRYTHDKSVTNIGNLQNVEINTYEKIFEFNKEIIIFKISLKDGSIVYSSYLGAYSDDEARALDIDKDGNIYITGYTKYVSPQDIQNYPYPTPVGYTDYEYIIPEFQSSVLTYSSPNLDTAPNDSLCSHKEYINPFVIKLTPYANNSTYTLNKVHIFGSYCIDRAFDVAVDKNGNLYVAGETYAGGDPDYKNFNLGYTSFSIGRNISNPSSSGIDVFVVQFDKNLLAKSARMLGSNGNDDVFGGIDTDDNGNVYLVGNATNGDFPVINNKFSANQTYGSCYVVKFNPSSASIAFSTYIDPQAGVSSQTGGQCRDMEVSPDGKIYIVGIADATNSGDAFAYIMDSSNQNTVHIEKISGSGFDEALSVDIDSIGNAYIFGNTQSQDLTEINPLQGFNIVDTQNGNTFLAKLSFKEKLEVSIDKQFQGQGTITSNPQGINCSNASGSSANSCSTAYNLGTKVTLTATPAQGNSFIEWHPDSDCSVCKTNQNCVITLDKYTNCVAVFSAGNNSGGGSGGSGGSGATNQPPKKPTVKASKLQGTHPFEVTFTCETTDPDGDTITSYEWTILNITSPSAKPEIKTTKDKSSTYKFQSAGTFEVSCSAIDSKGSQSDESNPITIESLPPNPNNNPPDINTFLPNPYSGNAPLKVTFNWDISDKDNDSVSCILDIDGDGTGDYHINDCINTKFQSHTYQTNGKYTAKIIATDSKGNKKEKMVNVEVYYKVTTKDGKEAKVLVENATIKEANISNTNNGNIPSLPANTKALYVISFKADLKQGENVANIKIKLSSTIPSNVKIYKLVNNQYIDITKEVSIDENTVEFKVKDDSKYDTNKNQGIIEDPIVIAEEIKQSNSSTTSGGGCSIGNSPNSLLLTIIILAVIFIRRRFIVS